MPIPFLNGCKSSLTRSEGGGLSLQLIATLLLPPHRTAFSHCLVNPRAGTEQKEVHYGKLNEDRRTTMEIMLPKR